MVDETKRETIENFKIFMSSLYEAQSCEENKKMFKQFETELRGCVGDTVTRIELTLTFADGSIEREKMLLSVAAKEGVEIPDDVVSFEVEVSVYSSTKEGNITSGLTKSVFKSKKFVVKANERKRKSDQEKRDEVVEIKDIDTYQMKTNNRIRFYRRLTIEQ